jgi:hypothetical protein
MWMYLGPSCQDRPFFKELRDMENSTRIHRVLAHGADLNPRARPTPLREGADITYVSLRGPSFCCLCQFLFPNAFVLLRRVSSVLTVLHGETRSKPCLQRAAVGTEREKTGPKCRLDGSEGKGEDTPSMPKTLKEKKEEGK